MRVDAGVRDGIMVLTYTGEHACSPEDHARDAEVRGVLEDAVDCGTREVLFDLLKLKVVYGSGLGDLVGSWGAALRRGAGVRCALAVKSGSRLAQIIEVTRLNEIVGVFDSEQDAREFLVATRALAERGLDDGILNRNGAIRLREPGECSEAERREFERMVREGFRGSNASLPDRIERAELLAFHYAMNGSLAAIAGLKRPDATQRRDVFERAAVPESPDVYGAELGWVYVTPSHRKRGLARAMCRHLMETQRGLRVFATTRPGNSAMIGILRGLGFARAGVAFRHRDDELVVFLKKPVFATD